MSRYAKDFEGDFAVVDGDRIASLHGYKMYAIAAANRMLDARKLDRTAAISVWKRDCALFWLTGALVTPDSECVWIPGDASE